MRDVFGRPRAVVARPRAVVARPRDTVDGAGDRGSTPVEFVLVAAVLTIMTLSVLQLGLAVYVRNVAHDAAVEGAYQAALADQGLADGVARTRTIIRRAVGPAYAENVHAHRTHLGDESVVTVTVRVPLPVVGLLGVPAVMEVTGGAPAEQLP